MRLKIKAPRKVAPGSLSIAFLGAHTPDLGPVGDSMSTRSCPTGFDPLALAPRRAAARCA